MAKNKVKSLSILRMYVALSGGIIASWLIRMHGTLNSTGYEMGFIVAVFSAFAFVDTLINDFLPKDITSEGTKRWRNLGFMGLGLCYACTVFFMFQHSEFPFLFAMRLVLDAIACAAIAFAGVGEVLAEEMEKPTRKKPYK